MNGAKSAKMTNKLHWTIIIEPEVATEYAGTKLGDYFTNPEVRVATELKSREIFHDLFDYGTPDMNSIGSPPLFYTCASVLGAEIIFPEDSSPMIKDRVIKDLQDIKNLKRVNIDDIASSGYVPYLINDYEYLKTKMAETGIVPTFSLPGQSPLGTAILLRGIDIFTDIVDHPLAIKDLLEVVTETAIQIIRFEERFTGKKRDSLGMDDDYGGLVSPEIYEEFNLPYMQKIYDEFGKKARFLHSETLGKEHLRFLRRIGITNYDAWPTRNLTVKDVKTELPGIFFTWNIETTRDLFSDTPKQVKSKFRQAVVDGAPGVVLDLCARNVSKKIIGAFIDAGRELNCGNYPALQGELIY